MTRERGFTLIELMIALLVSSLLVGLILAIFIRLSVAYRTQQQVAGVQQVLSAGGAALELDAKHAGAYIGDFFRMGDLNRYPAVRVVNSSNGPDQIGFYYGDPAVQAVINGGCDKLVCNVVSTAGFALGDVVVMSTPVVVPHPKLFPNETITLYYSCTLQILALTPTQLSFATAGPWGSGGNAHCLDIVDGNHVPDPPTDPIIEVPNLAQVVPPVGATTPVVGATRFYKLVARQYRIDPARPAEGVLQVSPTGDLAGANDWQDLAYGFTDIQIALRTFEDSDLVDPDLDGDPERDWYSGDNQVGLPADDLPHIISISLVSRTERDVEGIASTTTPALIVPANPTNNNIGDRAAVDLTATGDPMLQGQRIYRYTTLLVDMRNLGIAR